MSSGHLSAPQFVVGLFLCIPLGLVLSHYFIKACLYYCDRFVNWLYGDRFDKWLYERVQLYKRRRGL